MSVKSWIPHTRRYLRKFPQIYPQEILERLNVTKDKDNEFNPPSNINRYSYAKREQGRIAAPHCLSYRIPKSETTCTETLLRRMAQLNRDRRKGGVLPKEDRTLLKEIMWLHDEAEEAVQEVEDFWDRALQAGQVAEDHDLKYQFKQFKKVPALQHHPRQILLDVRMLKQEFLQRTLGVNSYETRHGGHDAALVLVTPGLAGLIGTESFHQTILGLWPDEARHWRHYHIVTAVVDGTHLPDEDSISTSEGISVIRGSKAVMFPDLWEDHEAREPEVKDDVGALTFEIGGAASVTVPLANTLFHNGKMSTLQASRVDADGATQTKELFERHIRLPSMESRKTPASHRTIHTLRLPLEAVTEPQIATESFGNILRRLDINGKSMPASVELEKAITEIQDRIAQRADELGFEFPGVWAVVYEKEKGNIPKWHVDTRSPHDEGGGTTNETIPNLLQLEGHGFPKNPFMGRPFKLLSGGGGWGDKAGLLALDPQTSHFAKSDEEMTESLFGNAGVSTYIPNGAAVQFFISNERPPPALGHEREYERRGSSRLADFPVDRPAAYFERGDTWDRKNKKRILKMEFFDPPKEPYFGIDGVPRVMFGVGSLLPPSQNHDSELSLHVGEFGVVSNKAIYMAEPETRPLTEHPGIQWAPPIKPMKLDMPGAQIQFFNW